MEVKMLNIAEMARKSQVNRRNLQAAIEGLRGLSMPVSKAVAQVYGTDAITLYVLSQAKSLGRKADEGDTPAVLRGMAGVMDELGKQKEEDLVAGGADLANAIHELNALLLRARAKALTFAKPARTQDGPETATLSDQTLRDAFGAVRRYESGAKKSRDVFGVAIPQGTGAERDGYGRKMG